MKKEIGKKKEKERKRKKKERKRKDGGKGVDTVDEGWNGLILTALVFIGTIDTIHYLVTLPVTRYAIGLIKYILSTTELIRGTVWWWTGLMFILSSVTVTLIVTHPSTRNATTIITTKIVR